MGALGMFVGLISIFFMIRMEISLALKLTVTPEHFKWENGREVTISCNLDQSETAAKEILALRISKIGEKDLVIMHPNNTITYGNSFMNRVQASGEIADRVGDSFLQFTITEPRMEDQGTYLCHVYYMDQAGVLRDDKATDFLTIDDPQIKAMKDNVQRLMDWNKKTEDRINALKHKSGSIIAFSATSNNRLMRPKAGQLMVFPDVIFQKGQGYDPSTGTFTAPRKGIYVFHLVIATACRDCFIKAQIQVNNYKAYTRLHAVNVEDSRQGTVTAMMQLDLADTVNVFVVDETEGVYLFFKKNCAFTGYLIRNLE